MEKSSGLQILWIRIRDYKSRIARGVRDYKSQTASGIIGTRTVRVRDCSRISGPEQRGSRLQIPNSGVRDYKSRIARDYKSRTASVLEFMAQVRRLAPVGRSGDLSVFQAVLRQSKRIEKVYISNDLPYLGHLPFT
ncbi:hypothetical protein [Algoriphagus taiwanensis]|uniref:Transposase n=1 Tax=Algoriphagus taiwanensis TaxID=1445656 RepID=A0ABQ6Q6L9_9BACT|nr:hypothetical protein Ataiwa_37790 [Algoriphagus taiwanensis]